MDEQQHSKQQFYSLIPLGDFKALLRKLLRRGRMTRLPMILLDWCDDHNEHAISELFLGLRLKEMGFDQKRSNDGRHWQGICLKADGG